jgi:UDP-MurNAc hydroxylase
MVTPLRAPSDGPIGDSSLSVDDGHLPASLNQNDSHPLDLEKLLGFAKPEAYFTQVSGRDLVAMVYDLPQDAKQNFAKLKRDAQNKRAMYYIEKVDAEHVFPMAGPPMFLREELFKLQRPGARRRRDLHRPARVPRAHARAAARAEGLRVPARHRRRAEPR